MRVLADPADHRQRYALDRPGVLQRLGEQRPEDDDDGDALDGATEAGLERGDEDLAVDARDEREQQDRHEDRDEDVPLEARDGEEEQGDDADKPGQRDQCTVGDLGVHVSVGWLVSIRVSLQTIHARSTRRHGEHEGRLFPRVLRVLRGSNAVQGLSTARSEESSRKTDSARCRRCKSTTGCSALPSGAVRDLLTARHARRGDPCIPGAARTAGKSRISPICIDRS